MSVEIVVVRAHGSLIRTCTVRDMEPVTFPPGHPHRQATFSTLMEPMAWERVRERGRQIELARRRTKQIRTWEREKTVLIPLPLLLANREEIERASFGKHGSSSSYGWGLNLTHGTGEARPGEKKRPSPVRACTFCSLGPEGRKEARKRDRETAV